jgi:hypothetical protein
VLPGYHERPGRYFLPSGFTPIRITKLLTNPFFFILLLTKPQTSGFGTNLGSRAKKLGIRVPTTINARRTKTGQLTFKQFIEVHFPYRANRMHLSTPGNSLTIKFMFSINITLLNMLVCPTNWPAFRI